MSYQKQLEEHFNTPELAEQFFFRVMKQLQLITCSGALKIEEVNGLSHTCITLQLPERKVGNVIVIPKKEHFIHSRVTLSETNHEQDAEIKNLKEQLRIALNEIHELANSAK